MTRTGNIGRYLGISSLRLWAGYGKRRTVRKLLFSAWLPVLLCLDEWTEVLFVEMGGGPSLEEEHGFGFGHVEF